MNEIQRKRKMTINDTKGDENLGYKTKNWRSDHTYLKGKRHEQNTPASYIMRFKV